MHSSYKYTVYILIVFSLLIFQNCGEPVPVAGVASSEVEEETDNLLNDEPDLIDSQLASDVRVDFQYASVQEHICAHKAGSDRCDPGIYFSAKASGLLPGKKIQLQIAYRETGSQGLTHPNLAIGCIEEDGVTETFELTRVVASPDSVRTNFVLGYEVDECDDVLGYPNFAFGHALIEDWLGFYVIPEDDGAPPEDEVLVTANGEPLLLTVNSGDTINFSAQGLGGPAIALGDAIGIDKTNPNIEHLNCENGIQFTPLDGNWTNLGGGKWQTSASYTAVSVQKLITVCVKNQTTDQLNKVHITVYPPGLTPVDPASLTVNGESAITVESGAPLSFSASGLGGNSTAKGWASASTTGYPECPDYGANYVSLDGNWDNNGGGNWSSNDAFHTGGLPLYLTVCVVNSSSEEIIDGVTIKINPPTPPPVTPVSLTVNGSSSITVGSGSTVNFVAEGLGDAATATGWADSSTVDYPDCPSPATYVSLDGNWTNNGNGNWSTSEMYAANETLYATVCVRNSSTGDVDSVHVKIDPPPVNLTVNGNSIITVASGTPLNFVATGLGGNSDAFGGAAISNTSYQPCPSLATFVSLAGNWANNGGGNWSTTETYNAAGSPLFMRICVYNSASGNLDSVRVRVNP